MGNASTHESTATEAMTQHKACKRSMSRVLESQRESSLRSHVNERGNVMTDDLEELKRRLVVGHKRDGRSVYDEKAKSELVALCLQPGASVSRLARECGVNANQVGRWLREHGHRLRV